MVSSVGRITDASIRAYWREMSRRRLVDGAVLLRQLEAYTETLARNLHQLFTQPFDAAHDNFGTSSNELVYKTY